MIPKYDAYSNFLLPSLLEENALRNPQKTAIIFNEQKISYQELDKLANRFANFLIKLGVSQSDRIALHLPNIPNFIIAYFGILKAGTTVTTISPLYRERELEHQLIDSGANTIVSTGTSYPTISNVMKKSNLKHLINTRVNESKPFEDFLQQSSDEKPSVKINPDDLAALQYTGGTTGIAKGAMLTHRNLVSNALAFASAIKGTTDDVFLTSLPLFHIYGMTTSMNTPISLGAKMVIMPKFDTAKTCENIQNHNVTVFCGVPIMYQSLLAKPNLNNYNLKTIRVCISGASSLPPSVQKQFMEVTDGFLAEGYGLTEASPVTHCNPVDKSSLHVGSIGLPIPGTEAKIIDQETGIKTLADEEVGELAVRGPQIMKGYWQQPDETAKTIRDGWLLTGDISYRDKEGYFYIVDRKKDLIKHKGFSIYPRELEDILYEHPAVKLCAIIGKLDEDADEVPVAFVVLKDGKSVSEASLLNYVNTRVASYKALHKVEFKKDLPISGSGKVLKRQLKETKS